MNLWFKYSLYKKSTLLKLSKKSKIIERLPNSDEYKIININENNIKLEKINKEELNILKYKQGNYDNNELLILKRNIKIDHDKNLEFYIKNIHDKKSVIAILISPDVMIVPCLVQA